MGTRALFPNPDCTAEVNRSPSRPAPEGSDGCRGGGGGAAPAQHRAERGTRTREHGGGAGTALEGAAQAGAGAEQRACRRFDGVGDAPLAPPAARYLDGSVFPDSSPSYRHKSCITGNSAKMCDHRAFAPGTRL